ncbi:MAG: hypothetical protein ACRCTE_09360 [Cellulosilyticaceae bacterium]
MNHKKEKIIYWFMGIGVGMVLSGMLMLGIGLKLIAPVDEIITQYKDTQEITPITQNVINNPITTSSDVAIEAQKKEEEMVVAVTIPPYLGSEEITELLKQYGVIEDSGAFNEYLKSKKKTRSLQHGTMYFPRQGQYSEILDILLRVNQ